ncbi:hypothetical protein NBRC10512_006650 [Rhodotorula toruloides]|uniref:RHTO0S07e04390g1_1 n=2 Tax=Rhodotorula toruloides TaxID=5286 RepID=A0A061AZ24_RHOTO|nr:uncharacterized protein RHTO_02854 [Rhodotorula toruloides NP11]EMS25127.1 hypothetical protein RHTO_02854 [Rhodotorula toruloides NP11]CDR42813.1 RHTO0S07e04390g1_1 [Rhodotorula toruloides]
MPPTASTSSPAPAATPPPPDERIPLSSVPDLVKLFPPLIQDVLGDETARGDAGAYHDELEQLYWMYSGWEEVLEDYKRDSQDYTAKEEQFNADEVRAAHGTMRDWGRVQARRPQLEESRRELRIRAQGPAGLAKLRESHLAQHPMLDPAQRLSALPSVNSRRGGFARLANLVAKPLHALLGTSAVRI